MKDDIAAAVELYRASRAEYEFNADPCCDDSLRARRLKWVLRYRLDAAERIIAILYAEVESIRTLAAMLGVARSTLGDEIKNIKDKILQEYKNAEQNGYRD